MIQYASEVSTPFLNLSWLMMKLKMKETKNFHRVASLMVFAFLIVRIVPIVPSWLKFYDVMMKSQSSPVFSYLRIAIIIVPKMTLDLLNIMWFHRMVSMFMKLKKDASKTA
jgi:hypothetical protein